MSMARLQLMTACTKSEARMGLLKAIGVALLGHGTTVV